MNNGKFNPQYLERYHEMIGNHQMKLNVFLFALAISKFCWSAPLEYLNIDWKEEITTTVPAVDLKKIFEPVINCTYQNEWSSIYPLHRAPYPLEKDQSDYNSPDEKIRFQGRYIYSSYQSLETAVRPADADVSNCIRAKFSFQRIDVQTGEKQTFKGPSDLSADAVLEFRMSPSGKYGLFYDRQNNVTYLTELNTGQVVYRANTAIPAVAPFFLADDTAGFYLDWGKILLVSPTGKTKQVLVSTDVVRYPNYLDRKFQGQKLYLISYKYGKRFILDFEKIDSKNFVAMSEELIQYPFVDSGHLGLDYIEPLKITCPLPWIGSGSSREEFCSEFETTGVKFVQHVFYEKERRLFTPFLESLYITRTGQVKRYHKVKEECLMPANGTLPVQGDLFETSLSSFCLTEIYDLKTEEKMSALRFASLPDLIKLPFNNTSDFASADSNIEDNIADSTNCSNTQNSVSCVDEVGPIPNLGNAKIRRRSSFQDTRINGFITRQFSQGWFFVTTGADNQENEILFSSKK